MAPGVWPEAVKHGGRIGHPRTAGQHRMLLMPSSGPSVRVTDARPSLSVLVLMVVAPPKLRRLVRR